MLDAILWQINDGAHPRPLLAKDANRDASQYFVDKCELSAVVTGIEKADGSYWCALGRVKRPEEGTGGGRSSKYAQNIHHLFHWPQYLISCFGYLFTSSVNAHLLHLDIYSLDIWPLNPNIFIHLMLNKYVRPLDLWKYLFIRVPTFVIAAIVWLLGAWVQVPICCDLTFWWQHQPKSPRWRWQSGWESFLIFTKGWQQCFLKDCLHQLLWWGFA